jgi:hypothetical protein
MSRPGSCTILNCYMAAPVYWGHAHIHFMVLHICSGHQKITSSSPLVRHLKVVHPWIIRRLQSACFESHRGHHYGGTWPRFSTSIKHLETDISRPGFKTPTSCTGGGHSSKELFEQFTHLTIPIRYSTVSQCLVLCPAEVTCLPLQALGKFPFNYHSRGCSFSFSFYILARVSDPDPAFFLIADPDSGSGFRIRIPDPDSGFDDLK